MKRVIFSASILIAILIASPASAKWQTTNAQLPFEVKACLGEIPGVSCVIKFGQNQDLDTSQKETLWVNSNLLVRPTTGQIIEVYSTSAADDSGSTGCTEISWYGITNDWDRSSGTATMDGAAYVVLPTNLAGVDRMICDSYGSGKINAGGIYAIATVDKTTQAYILAGEGQTLQAFWYVPRYHDLLLVNTWASLNKSGGLGALADIDLVIEPNADGSSGFNTKRHYAIARDGANPSPLPYPLPLLVPGRSLVEMRVHNSNVADNDLSGGFSGYLINRTR